MLSYTAGAPSPDRFVVREPGARGWIARFRATKSSQQQASSKREHQVPGKVRVYELARELGLTNKETLDLCESLGIGVKSHSSSVVEAQADRVRRKAEREGLVRDEQPEEPKKAPSKKAKKAPAKKVSSKKPPEKAPPARAPAEEAAREKQEAEPAAPTEPAPAVAEAVAPEQAPAATPPTPEPVATPAPPEKPAASKPRVVTSSGSQHPPKPAPADEGVEPTGSAAPASAESPTPAARTKPTPEVVPTVPAKAPAAQAKASAAQADSAATTDAPTADTSPTSASGKSIPPPPGPPTSVSGKPIPPPPGQGGRRAPSRPGGPSGPGAGTGAPRRPSGGGRPPAGGGRRQQVPGAGGPPSGGGGPGGRGRGPQRRPPRRRSRRRRQREELQPMDAPSYTPKEAPVPDGEVVIERASTPQEIGSKLNRTGADVVRYLMQQGEMVTATQSLSDEMIELFAMEVGATIRLVDPGEEKEVELQKMLAVDTLSDEADAGQGRPPVITVMGHVDHGKTKLLDQIRDANVAEGEAGGITQHIGAYQVDQDGRAITFIDTPGHEAFTAMRARGATATDIVILVVAADDGVMPQTIEAINHAKAAEVPIVVAVNKIDRDNANPDRVLQQLSEHDLVPESWGGDTVVCQISALENTGIDELLENVLVVAELEDLSATADGRAKGVVLESHLDKGRGPVATVLVQRGTLSVGDPVVAGSAWGRVRALIDDTGQQVKTVGPSTPVQVLGLSDIAVAGEEFVVAQDDKIAGKVADTREHYERVATVSREAKASGGAKLEDIFTQIQAGETATLNLVVKADVNGSLEALTDALTKLERDEVKLAFVHRGVGGITKNDIQLAAASNATIIGFNVRPDRQARELADLEHVEIRSYEIIYDVLEDIESAMLGMLEPEFEEVVTGDAEVREIFGIPRVGKVAGCYVQNGTITRGSKVRFLREGAIIWKGEISSLKRFKEDAREVQAGYECGIGLSDFQDLKAGDVIETFDMKEIPRT